MYFELQLSAAVCTHIVRNPAWLEDTVMGGHLVGRYVVELGVSELYLAAIRAGCV